MASDLKTVTDFTVAKAQHENVPASSDKANRVQYGDKLADPWAGWEQDGNRLEASWRRYPRGMLQSKDKPFPVDEGEVNASGEVEFKWTVWTDSQKLKNHQVELYAVMRAEHKYISQGYKKIASKYFYWRPIDGGRKIPVENCGIDSFFEKNGQYVVCESKFTRDPSKFAHWKKLKNWGSTTKPALPERPVRLHVWQLMGKYTADRKKCRQMSWDWLQDRAKKAVNKPAPRAPAGSAEEAAIKAEAIRMGKAVSYSTDLERVVNVYGADRVPIYPGWYTFVCAKYATPSINELHLKWTLDLAEDEFVTLDHYFDKWAWENR
jgi:hypothetical protein